MKKILIVDDAMFMRSTLKMMLRKENYEVVGEAQNGLEAIEKFKTLKPDIVTLDIHMPEMGGIDTLEMIMKLDSNAKVVMISAAGDQKHVLDALKLGATNFIIKPFSEDKVFQVMNKI
ncbi:MAG: response regulator [Clostridiales bacterium]|nr:response regulator [Clostridiales bacterium]